MKVMIMSIASGSILAFCFTTAGLCFTGGSIDEACDVFR